MFCCPTRCQPSWNDRRILQIQKYLQKYRVSKRMILHWKVLENGWQRMLLTSVPRFEWIRIIPHKKKDKIRRMCSGTHAPTSPRCHRQCCLPRALGSSTIRLTDKSTVSKLYPISMNLSHFSFRHLAPQESEIPSIKTCHSFFLNPCVFSLKSMYDLRSEQWIG